ncbi:MAG: aldolase/citrate lyase family protein, partial [Gammaproteobacteria bacterium]
MTRLRRAVHFVPGGNERMLAKALTLEADTLVLDLEDAVTPERKDAVRAEMLRWLQDVDFGHQEKMVRMNPLESPWGLADLELTIRSPPDCYMVPKV